MRHCIRDCFGLFRRVSDQAITVASRSRTKEKNLSGSGCSNRNL
jgi:hypothetical protein